jgi:hypothetical protein
VKGRGAARSRLDRSKEMARSAAFWPVICTIIGILKPLAAPPFFLPGSAGLIPTWSAVPFLKRGEPSGANEHQNDGPLESAS